MHRVAQGGTVSRANQSIASGTTIGALPVPVRMYSAFDGWFTLPNGAGVEYTADSVYHFTVDTTLYAKWTVDVEALLVAVALLQERVTDLQEDSIVSHGRIADLQADSATSHGIISDLRVDSVAKEWWIANLQADSIASHGIISDLRVDSVAKEWWIADLQADSVASHGRVAALQTDSIVSHGIISDLRVDSVTKEWWIADLQTDNIDKQEQISALQVVLSDTVDTLQAQIEALQAQSAVLPDTVYQTDTMYVPQNVYVHDTIEPYINISVSGASLFPSVFNLSTVEYMVNRNSNTMQPTVISVIIGDKIYDITISNATNGATAVVGTQNLAPLQIYPNPTINEQLTIDNGQLPAGSKVEIYSVNGGLVGVYDVSDGKSTTLNLSHLSQGTYIVKVGNKAAKVVKQ
jgi:hypothetical protein